MNSILREAIEIELHPSNIKRESDSFLGKSWKPLTGFLNTFST
jgi:hypothetical protein